MSFTFASLQTEFYSRGPDYLQDDAAGQTRAKQWLNLAYHDVCERADWPFLQATVTGVAPYVFTDMRAVLSVVDTTSQAPLVGTDREWLIASVTTDLTSTGTPRWWYFADDTTDGTLGVYPANTTDTLSIRYVKFPADLVNDGDVAVIPDRFQDLIIDGALVWAHKDNDAYQKANALSQMFEAGVQRMFMSLMARNHQSPSFIAAVRSGNY